ncbi:MAG: methylenetetrahydrofolate reductase [NAD(P)H] [Sulfuricaulis sp.]
MESQKKSPRAYSFEYFPPRNEDGRIKLRETTEQLAQLKPKFFSVTFGAGGSTRAGTYETVKQIQAQGQRAAPHISCIGTTRADIRQLLDSYRRLGISHLVTLRGDRPKDAPNTGDFHFANELVRFIRAETGSEFTIEVAGYPEFHPESTDAASDIRHFVNKIEAGADSAITQYFFNIDAYWRFVEDCQAAGAQVPIVPGIMPVTNFKQLAKFSDACGAEIPRWIRRRLEGFGEDLDSIRAFGLDVVTDLCDKLLAGGAPGLHFYTLNRAAPTCTVWERLGL